MAFPLRKRKRNKLFFHLFKVYQLIISDFRVSVQCLTMCIAKRARKQASVVVVVTSGMIKFALKEQSSAKRESGSESMINCAASELSLFLSQHDPVISVLTLTAFSPSRRLIPTRRGV